MTSPNRPSCGNLTQHDQHPLNGGVDFADQGWCPGVPNLAEPAAQQPLSRGDDLRQALGAALSQVYEAQHALTGWHADGVTLSDAAWALVEPLIADRDARVRAQVAEEIAEAIESHHASDNITAIQAARIARHHAAVPPVRHEDSTAGDSGTQARCRKCAGPLVPCATCAEPAQCGEAFCVEHEPITEEGTNAS